MYCRNCGNPMDNMAAVCVKCGYAAGSGVNFCPNCGAQTVPGAPYCTSCGIALAQPISTSMQKSKIAAGLLGIFLGCLGVHNFYLGETGKAVAQLLLTLIGWILCGMGPVAAAIWGLIEGIMLLSGGITVDGRGIPLKD